MGNPLCKIELPVYSKSLKQALLLQACDVTSQNDALIVCSIKNLGLAGANNVSVYVPGKGNAALTNGSVTTTAFVNPLIISGVSPQAISRAGGGYVTLTGMPHCMWCLACKSMAVIIKTRSNNCSITTVCF